VQKKLFHSETDDEKTSKLRADKMFFLSFYADSYCLTLYNLTHTPLLHSRFQTSQAKFLLSPDYAICNIACLDDVLCLHKDFKNLYVV